MTAAKPPAAAKKKPAAKKAPPIEAEAVVIEREEATLVVSGVVDGVIVANFDPLKQHIESILVDYRGVTITRPYLKQGKKDRAYLRGLVKSTNQRRIDAKRAISKPIEVFEREVKELLAPVEQVIDELDVQIKALEEEERTAKLEAIREHWIAFAGLLADVVKFETVFDEKWLGVTVDIHAAQQAVEEAVRKIIADENTLSTLGLRYENDAKATYFATLDLSAAITRAKELEAQADAAAALQVEKDAYEAARAVEVEAPAEPAEVVERIDAILVDETQIPAEEIVYHEEPAAWLLRFTCTRAELDDVLAYLKSVGITGRAGRDNGGS